jgi:hypothetical protein
MPVKLIQYWNIIHGRKEDFDRFFMKEFMPEINESGHMKMVGSWLVASGEGPHFVAEGVSNSVEEMENLIMGTTFVDLRQKLFRLVQDYSTKLLVPTGRIDPQPIEIEWGYKFNRHFNINPADYYECHAFMEREYFPRMVDFGNQMVGEWYVDVGATPYVIAESRAEKLTTIGEMLEHAEYQRLTLQLLNMVSNYGCKVLVPSGHINK